MSNRTKTKRRNKSGKGRTPRYAPEEHALVHGYTLFAASTEPLETITVTKLMTGYYAALNELSDGSMGLGGFVRLSEAVMILAELTALLAASGTDRVKAHYLTPHQEARDAADHLQALGERYNTHNRFIAKGGELTTLKRVVSYFHEVVEQSPSGLVLQAMRQSARTIRPQALNLGVPYGDQAWIGPYR